MVTEPAEVWLLSLRCTGQPVLSAVETSRGVHGFCSINLINSNMTSKLGTIFLVLALGIFTTSCIVPSSKENYIKNFERFVKDVEKNGEKFKASDWKWANERFSKYSGEWYERYQPEMNLEEKMKITSLRTRYQVAKGGSTIGKLINDNLRKEFNQIGDEMKKYLDENLDKDIEEIKKGAQEIGDSAVKVMEDVLKEIKKKKE
jgi:hypothetical protein